MGKPLPPKDDPVSGEVEDILELGGKQAFGNRLQNMAYLWTRGFEDKPNKAFALSGSVRKRFQGGMFCVISTCEIFIALAKGSDELGKSETPAAF